MKRALKLAGVALGIVLFFLIGCFAVDQIPYSRAKPPKQVVDISSCLAWLKNPMGTYRITTDGGVYYQITGSAGRYLASGPSAYSFDSQGKFLGWTSDMGDFKKPTEVFAENSKREKISLDEIKRAFKL